jgi:diacylglycerol kinase (ATP)
MCQTTTSPRSPSICVIFNPAAGRSRARQRLESMSGGWLTKAELWPTERPGHAIELARRAASNGFEIVAAAGGDGTVHEVANGVLQADRRDVCFAVIPLGSADDYAHSLVYPHDGEPADTRRAKMVDVGLVRIGSGIERFFVCGVGIGLSACVTVESQQIRRLQGQLLYGLAALKAIWNRWDYLELTGTIDGKPLSMNPTLLISVLLGRREGGFVMAPEARLDDGWFDCVHAGNLTRWEALRMIPGISTMGPPRDHPKVHLRRCRHLVIESAQDLVIHTDGEILSRPEDRVRRVEIELLPARLLVRHGLDQLED